jgi:hypothetical protein
MENYAKRTQKRTIIFRDGNNGEKEIFTLVLQKPLILEGSQWKFAE